MKRFFGNILNIREGTDYERTRAVITGGIKLRGYNFWILICSVVLASIGLDTNSTAIIIGAMLISPLMSPILGVGMGVAVHDKRLLLHSLRNLLLAMLISLVVSVLYFLVSPLGQVTPELKARTFPTLLDVLVALFGGIAGIVSTSRHDQTNAIPGVAIATALMPPLCTAGFGLATHNWMFFFGAFYLFFINSVFISLATFLIVRYLRFPSKDFVSGRSAAWYRFWFVLLGIIALAPSIYFLYTLYKDELVKEDIDTYVISPVKKQGNEILKWEIIDRDTAYFVKVYHSGMALSDSFKAAVRKDLDSHGLGKYYFVPSRINLTKEEIGKLSGDMTRQIIEELHLSELHDTIASRQGKTDSLLPQVMKEMALAFPFIDSAAAGQLTYPQQNRTDTMPVIYFYSKKPLSKPELQQADQYLRLRLDADTLLLIRK